MISMKSLASDSGNARTFVRSSFDDKHNRNDSANSTDLESSDERKCNLGEALVENTSPFGCQVVAS